MIPIVVFLAVFGLHFRLIGDEGAYANTIALFAEQWPRMDIRDYFAPSPPLPFFLLVGWGQLVGFEPWKLRLIPLTFTVLSVNLFYDLAREKQLPFPVWSTLSLLFFPYIFFHGFTFYMDSFGLFFGMGSLRFYLRDEATLKDYLWGGILSAAAVYSRQSYIALPAGLALYELVRLRPVSVARLRERLPMILSLAIPLIAFVPMIVLWGSFTPPSHQADKVLSIVPLRTNYIAIFVAVYFLPFIDPPRTWRVMRERPITWAAAGILTVGYFLFTPVFDEVNQHQAITGLAMHSFDVLRERALPLLGDIAQFGAWLIGVLIILRELAEEGWDTLKGKLLAMLLAFAVLITITPRTTDRYFIQTVPMLILLLHGSFERRRWLQAWTLLLMLISAGFTVWQVVFKSFEGWSGFN